MAFEFPQDIAPELYPLAWLVGTWRGQGVLEYPGIDKAVLTQEITFDHDGGPYLRYESTIKSLGDGTADPHVWSTETGYWRVAPEPHEGIKEGQTSLEVLLADPAGRVTVYIGAAGDGRVDLVSDVIARTTTGAEVSASSRMYGNVAGELMWVHSIAAFGNPLQSYVSAQLARVEKE